MRKLVNGKMENYTEPRTAEQEKKRKERVQKVYEKYGIKARVN